MRKAVTKGLALLSVLMMTTPLAAAEKSPVMKLAFRNVLQEGKKTWTPGEVTVKEGTKVEITLENTLGEEHGFMIPGMVDAVVVGPKAKKKVTFEAKGEGPHDFTCHMHPAHVGGKLIITK